MRSKFLSLLITNFVLRTACGIVVVDEAQTQSEVGIACRLLTGSTFKHASTKFPCPLSRDPLFNFIFWTGLFFRLDLSTASHAARRYGDRVLHVAMTAV